ncbi:hypothetical protein F5B20DRAFT_418294 [Whalleya microplaca]|nr:hypothetical protein F5B20DRAFT_418294 [Whalleya microplaca]
MRLFSHYHIISNLLQIRPSNLLCRHLDPVYTLIFKMSPYVTYPTLPYVRAQLIGACVVAGLALVLVGLRIFSRLYTKVKLWWDDWLALISVPQGIALLVLQGMFAILGNGYNILDVLTNVTTLGKLIMALEMIYASCLCTVKLSMLCFYSRMFKNHRPLQTAIKAASALVIIWTIANLLQPLLLCRPLRRLWDISAEGTCGDRKASFIAIGSFSIVTDLIILVLPLPAVWKLQMGSRTKLGLTFCFLLGLFVTITAIARIVYLNRLEPEGNFTYYMPESIFLTTLEGNMSIICVSLPMVRGIYVKWKSGRRLTETRGTGSSQSESYQARLGTGRKFPGEERLMPTKAWIELRDSPVATDSSGFRNYIRESGSRDNPYVGEGSGTGMTQIHPSSRVVMASNGRWISHDDSQTTTWR